MLIPTIIFSLISRILSLFGLGKKNSRGRRGNSRDAGYGNTAGPHRQKDAKGTRKRIFEKDEGEYVDFEEIK